MRRRELFRLSAGVALLGGAPGLLAACGSDRASAEEARSDAARATPDGPARADIAALVRDNTAFAWDIQRAAGGPPGNFVASPYSISQALAMVWAGARSETADEIADALRFSLPQERFHPAFNALSLALPASSEGFRLAIANAAWGQRDRRFEQPFLDTLARYYDAGLRLLDFRGEPEPSRVIINGWVADQTEDRIPELLPPGVINDMTRLVLTNAVYFNALWEKQFRKDRTTSQPFHGLDGGTASLPTMSQRETFAYHAGATFTAVELPYQGGRFSMLILMPAPGTFADYEARLDAETVASIAAGLAEGDILLSLPKFSFRTELSLPAALKELGMRLAFESPPIPDFSGIDGTRELFVSDVIHEAWIRVDEKGTEAAAATAAIADAVSAPPSIVIDHPFLFVIRDRETGALLFTGRVVMPEGGAG